MSYERLQLTDFVDKWDVEKVKHLEDAIIANENAIINKSQSDWDQTDSSANDFIKNKTHGRAKSPGTTYCSFYDFSTLEFETYIDNGEEKYRWVQDEYQLIPSKGQSLPAITRDMLDSELLREVYVESQGLFGDNIITTMTRGKAYEGGDWYQAVIHTDNFTLKGPTTKDSIICTFIPHTPPTQQFVFGEDKTLRVSKVAYEYNKLDINYLPAIDIVDDINTRIPTCQAVYNALLTDVDFNNLINKPIYYYPETKVSLLDDYYYFNSESASLPYDCKIINNHKYEVQHYFKDYTVIAYEGDTYVGEADRILTSVFLGNGSLFSDDFEDTGESFLIRTTEFGSAIWDRDFEGEGSVSIYHFVPEQVKKLDEKCIPDTVARTTTTILEDVIAAPTAEQYNALLQVLREAGILATE